MSTVLICPALVHIPEKVMMDLLQLLHGAVDLEVRILGKFIAPRHAQIGFGLLQDPGIRNAQLVPEYPSSRYEVRVIAAVHDQSAPYLALVRATRPAALILPST